MLKQDSVGLTSSRIIYFLVLLTSVLAVSILKYFLKWLDVFSDHKASNPCIHSTTTLWRNGCSSEEGQGFIGISNVTLDLVFVFNVGLYVSYVLSCTFCLFRWISYHTDYFLFTNVTLWRLLNSWYSEIWYTK